MRIIVYTAHYPFGTGEQFFEDEIVFLSSNFDRVIIVSMDSGKSNATRIVPQNVEVVRARERTNTMKLVPHMLKYICSTAILKEIHFARKTRKESFKYIVKQIFTAINTWCILDDNSSFWKSNSDTTLFYSYWLNNVATYLAENKKKFNGTVVARAHGYDCFFDRDYIPFRREQLLGLDGIFSISEAGAKDIKKHYPNSVKGNLFISKLGVINDSEVLNPYSEEKVKRIVTCSNIVRIKRLDLLIDALSLIDKLCVEWIHIGDGPDRKQIEAYASDKLNKADNITYNFFGGISKRDVLKYYEEHSIDLFVNCSDGEGIPVSIMEVMSYGIPVLARNVGGISEIVDNRCGVLLPEKAAANDLASAITDFFSVPDYPTKRILYGEQAMQKAMKEYNASNNYESFCKRIKELKT